MKALVMTGYGGNDVVELREVPKPVAGEDDVLIEVCAASVNPVDFKIRDGKLRVLLKYRMPLIMGSDLAGIVVAVGGRVIRFKPGDEVFARVGKLRIGTFAEYIAVTQDEVALKPSNLTFEEAASLPLVGLTVYQALVDVAKVQAGQKVFIPAGSGGVGTFAIQFAKSLGAEVAT
ncbi:MAG: NADP-dependent oxidoreductase, partial [Deltaproteobacteria bacterium]|nr:NADP-dependent oxidoreductase [Deltaproteobacteria bacterium]